MPAHTSHILQPLDVSCFSPLKRAYSSQMENKLRLGIHHITKEEFLPAFLTAHIQVFTIENITAGFRATGLVPFNPEEVLSNLGPIHHATPSPRSSQASYNPKTPRTLSEVQKQTKHIMIEGRKRRRSSASSYDRPLLQMQKGFEKLVHNQELMLAELTALRTENQHQKQKRARRKGFIQKGGSMTVQEGQQAVQDRVVVKKSFIQDENVDPAILTKQLEVPCKKAPSKSSKCGSYRHTARSCSV